MEETKEKNKEMEKKESNRSHFTKVIEYNRESWLTDIILGQKKSYSHAHATLSGAEFWYLRDEMGNEIIRNGILVNQNTL
jgi:hypothetical protein